MTAAIAAVSAAALLVTSPPAAADGAFPDGQSVLVPGDRPRQIILAATFGLVVSEDDGATWQYACESEATRMGRLYMMGPAPERRLHATTERGAAVSADDGCTWAIGGGALRDGFVFDVFPDPVDARRVAAVAVPASDDIPMSVYLSADGGATYAGPVFQAPGLGLGNVTGVEIAAADNRLMYVTLSEGAEVRPRLARSDDGGASWTTLDLEASLGLVLPRLLAIDRTDPRKVYLRVSGKLAGALDETRSFEALAITTDGGATWSVPVTVAEGRLTAFLRRQDGTLLVTAADGTGAPRGFQSDDGGATFRDWPLGVHPRGLAERGSTLFVAADNFVDGFALGSSDDGGASWRPRLRFQDISGVRACVRNTCQADCDDLAGRKLFSPETCNPPGDGGAAPPDRGGGCGCALPHAADKAPRALLLGTLLALPSLVVAGRRSVSARRRCRRSRCRTPTTPAGSGTPSS